MIYEHHREFVVGKNKAGVIKLENHSENVEDVDIFCGFVSQEKFKFILENVSDSAFEKQQIDISDYEYDEIPNESVDWFIDLIGENKDKCPVFCKALEYAKESGGIIQVCF